MLRQSTNTCAISPTPAHVGSHRELGVTVSGMAARQSVCCKQAENEKQGAHHVDQSYLGLQRYAVVMDQTKKHREGMVRCTNKRAGPQHAVTMDPNNV